MKKKNMAKSNLVFLLSPAKSLDFSFLKLRKKLPFSSPVYLKKTDALVKELKKMSKGSLKTLLGVSDSLATLNHERNKNFKLSTGAKKSKPIEGTFKQCILAYDGAAYGGLQAPISLTDKDLEYCNDHLRILSGLYGVLKPMDLIQPYRLDFGKKLKVDGNSNLYEFWGDDVATEIDKAVGKNGIVVNCASQEYFKGTNKALKSKVVNCEFKDDGRIVSVFAKRARGLMVRYAAKERVENLDDLKNFNYEGYQFNAKKSTDTNYIFERTAKSRPSKPKKRAAPAKASGSQAKKKKS